MKNRKLISLVVVFVFIFSFINYIKLDTNTFAKSINNYSCDYYETSEPIRTYESVLEIFSKYDINNEDNLLMVGCNKDYILDFRLVGNAIGVVRDVVFGGYYICYENEEDLEYDKKLLENDPNIEYAEKNEELELEDDSNINEENAKLLTCEEENLDINKDNTLEHTKIREYIDKLDNASKERKVKVGIISSGIYKDHELFQGVIEGGYDFYNDDDTPEDSYGEGTYPAGIIANALKGLNYKIAPYRVFEKIRFKGIDKEKDGKTFKETTQARICEAIKQAIIDKCDVIYVGLAAKGSDNGDYTDCKYNEDGDEAIHDAVEEALNAGICVVATAGEAGVDAKKYCPAHMQHKDDEVNHDIISVGGAKKEQGYYKVSNSNYGDVVDLYVLSDNVITTYYSSNNYCKVSGPRMAAAFVSAMAAVLKAKDPNLTSIDIEKTLKDNAIEFDDEFYDYTINKSVPIEKAKLATFEKLLNKDTEPEPDPEPEPKLVEVYRLRNKTTGAHYYTIYANEKEKLKKTGWEVEKMKWYGLKDEIDGAVGVYKLYNKKSGRHLFTAKEGEIKNLVESYGWELQNNKKPIFYSYGNIEIYRLYNPNDGDHLLTTSKPEREKLIKLGWEYYKSDDLHAFKEE